MYCPKCSMLLEMVNEHYVCTSGYLEYSVHLSKVLEEYFTEKSNRFRLGVFGGGQFCPQCGENLNGTKCQACEIDIHPIQHELIEFHPHGTPEGRYI